MIDEQQYEASGSEHGEIEQQARAMGWRPKEEFNGDESKYVDAEQFLESINNSAPAMRERLDKATKKLLEQEDRQRQLEDHLNTLIDNMEKFQQQQYQRAYDDIMQQQRAAVKRGDDRTWEALEKKKQELANQGEKEPTRQGANQQQGLPPEVDSFLRQNPWYSDPQYSHMRKYADAIDDELYKQSPGRPIDEHLRLVRQGMEEKFPDFFGVKPRKKERSNKLSASMVEGGGKMVSGNESDGTDVFPPAVREFYKRRVKQGKYSSMDALARFQSGLVTADREGKKMKLVGTGRDPEIVLEDRN